MPLSAVKNFSEPDEYAAAIRAAVSELTLSGRGDFSATQTWADLHHLTVQRLSDNLPRILHLDHLAGRAIFSFNTQPGLTLLASGVEFRSSAITRHHEGHSYYQRSSGPSSFGGMSLPIHKLVSIGETMGGWDLSPPRDALLIVPPAGAMARLHRLHAAAAGLAETSPEIIADPNAARALEQTLVEALIGCLSRGEVREDGVAQRQHVLIMRRFRRVVEENADRPLYMPEICTAIGVSERTLRICCQEHLGMGPKHYLVLRRLHMASRELRRADLNATTVTEIATRYGFWHFGRFAAAYETAMGELPSATLLRRRA